MSRRARLALSAGLLCAAAGVAVGVAAGAEPDPEPQPAPSRVYSSCLVADTKPIPPGEDPCDLR
ncbi:hypothetical protein ABZS76_34660 [Streptomyces sp. NPDC005562]|uniref:hypothetical protein n=1 Tax=Streptomyces sp. NPDC005562 TaxID=3154890 RepID=UPI0033A0F218